VATCGAALGAAAAAWSASEQANFSQDAERRQLRAYVEVRFMDQDEFSCTNAGKAYVCLDPSKPLRFALSITNKALSPAYHVVDSTHSEITSYPLETSFTSQLKNPETIGGTGSTLFPNGADPDYIFIDRNPISDAQKKQIAEGDSSRVVI
jgi:hypothetical protein